MDKLFPIFLRKFGQPSSIEAVPETAFLKYESIFPDSLLSYWKEYGWCSFADGLIWMVNPEIFDDIISDWVKDIPEFIGHEFHVFARSAFGNLYAWEPKLGFVIRVVCTQGFILTEKIYQRKIEKMNLEIQSFFVAASQKDFDMTDESRSPLFRRAVEKLGALDNTELYGFEPLLILGGRLVLENVKKLRMDVHLEIMRQFTDPKLAQI